VRGTIRAFVSVDDLNVRHQYMTLRDLLSPDLAIPIALLILALGPGIWYARRNGRQAEESHLRRLDKWALENGMRIIRAERRVLFLGPLTWKQAKGIGYKIAVETSQHALKTGWIIFSGHQFTSDKYITINVAWDASLPNNHRTRLLPRTRSRQGRSHATAKRGSFQR
jgi:hypothetical protein